METFLLFDRNTAIKLQSLYKFPYRQGEGDRYLFTVPAPDAENFRWAIVNLDVECLQVG